MLADGSVKKKLPVMRIKPYPSDQINALSLKPRLIRRYNEIGIKIACKFVEVKKSGRPYEIKIVFLPNPIWEVDEIL